MSKGEEEAKHADLDKVEKQDKENHNSNVREGKADASVWGDEEKPGLNEYPKKDLNRHQEEDQPEFTEPYSNQSKDIEGDEGIEEK